MKKNKSLGFTLIELLAVIVILAVIAIIITPMIANTINNVKAGAIKASVYSIAHSSKQYCVNKQATDGKFQEKSYELNKDNATLIGFTYNSSLTGIISIYSDCSVAVKATDGTYYASKPANSDDIAYGLKPADFDPTDITITTPTSCFATSDNGDNTVTITSYTCPNQDLIIPGTINGHAVTKIADDSFEKKGITSVNFSLMKNLAEIGDHAFSENNITYLTISNLPKLTAIDMDAFFYSGIQVLEVSNLPALINVGEGAFNTDPLSYITLDNLASLANINNYAFYGTTTKSLVIKNIPNLIAFSGNEFLRPNANTMTLTLDNLAGLTKLDTWSGYKISDISLTNLPNLQTISNFTSTQLSSLTISNLPALTTISNMQSNPFTDLVIKDLPKLTTITSTSFTGCPNLKNVTLSNLPLLTEISNATFPGNQIQSLNLSGLNSLTRIGNQAFADNKLSSLTLSSLPALTTIDIGAFAGNMLKNINISSMPNLVVINGSAFDGNPIESLTLKDLPKLTTIGGGAFYRIDANDGTKCAVTYTFDNIPAVSAYNSTTGAGLNSGAFPNADSCAGISPTVIFKNTISDPLRNYNFNNVVASD